MYFDPQHYIGTIFIEPNSRNPLNPDLEPDPQKNWKSGVSGTFFLNFPRCSYLVMKQLISAENSSEYCTSSEWTCSGCSLYDGDGAPETALAISDSYLDWPGFRPRQCCQCPSVRASSMRRSWRGRSQPSFGPAAKAQRNRMFSETGD